MSKYAKLRQLAEKASPGPWIAYINRHAPAPAVFGPEGVQANSKGAIINWPGFDSADTTKAAMKANARFIAAANPVAVSRLIDDYAALAAENERLRIRHESATATDRNRIAGLREDVAFLERQRDSLTARVAELERDAARYRWLRDRGFQYADADLGTDFHGDNFVSFRMRFNLPEPPHSNYEFEEWDAPEIDASIDAAMQQEADQ